jgi:hypothetical protein
MPIEGDNYVIVDEPDADLVRSKKWWLDPSGYVARSEKVKGRQFTLLLHRVIMKAGPDDYVDHKNAARIDCRRTNMRLVTNGLNVANARKRYTAKPDRVCKSEYKGVCFRDDRQRWIAYIGGGPSRRYLGSFKREIDAAEAYNEAARETFGEHARLNAITQS